MVSLMYQAVGTTTGIMSVTAPRLLIAAAMLHVPTVVYVVLSGDSAIATVAALFEASLEHARTTFVG